MTIFVDIVKKDGTVDKNQFTHIHAYSVTRDIENHCKKLVYLKVSRFGKVNKFYRKYPYDSLLTIRELEYKSREQLKNEEQDK